MAANPIISSAASLLVPWEASRTVTCHCRRCDALLAIAPNSWTSCDSYLFTPGSICLFDNNILSNPRSEPHPTEDGQYQSTICKNCLETVGQGVQKEMFKDGYPQFNLFWSSHSILLRDLTTRELVPSRLDAVTKQSSLEAADPNNCEKRTYQQQTGGQSGSKDNERHLNTPSARATSDEMHVMINEWKHTISSLRDEIQCLKTTISSRNHTPQAPLHDGYELIATALREVRAKGIEIEALKQENHSLRFKCSQLENMLLTRVEPTSGLNNRPFVASPNIDGGALVLNQRDHPLDLNSNGKRPFPEEISLFDAGRGQRNSEGRNSTANTASQPLYNNSQPIRLVSNITHHGGSNSDTDELAEPWQGPKYRALSSNVNCRESNAKDSRTSPNKRQAHERNQAFQVDPTKPSQENATRKKPPGRPRRGSLSAKASTKKIPLKESDTNTQVTTKPPGPTEAINGQAVEPRTLDNPQPVNRARRASARLSRRSSLAPPDNENTQHSSSTEPNQVHTGEEPVAQLQGGELQESPSSPAPNIQTHEQTIPNSQTDSDNPPLDQKDSRPIVNEQEESTQTTAKSTRSLHHPTRGRRKSQIAARDSLAKLAMQREEALEMAAG
ncbi:hypothetical protein BDBG_00025 [Blastomyces gilchristii SLH14081]|uniref:Uncharacterized protein n=1 Tax=Blastomyces gilchristii (strain SLH14081) TaxID=559298 RepID=A0A179U650_BLAGS|nr:uncharacterized protein BDBG_00025 [Blastomyces gilchristii SLH14081]OAT03290.1 hypothetical protein BDBG_00025 [Blastomyces gilchristii SLH14081]